MKIYIGADHRGFKLKEQVKLWLVEQGHEVVDCGNTVHDKDDDFPDFSFAVADKVSKDLNSKGVVICGSAGGVVIAANKVKGIRCVWGVTQVDMVHNRKHDDVNVLAIGSDYVGFDDIASLITTFLATPFEANEDRLVRRLEKIKKRENEWG